MLIDLHAHSSGISKCCKIPAAQVIEEAIRVGLDGIVLTNHYQKNYVGDGDYDAFARRYLAEYENAARIGEEKGLRVLFGIEVTMEQYYGVHMLIYGVGTDFVTRYPMMFDLSQEELYRLVKKNCGVLVQAHPYRRADRLLDVRFLDGVEISCHLLYEGTHLDALAKVATDAGLILTSGGDYHADTPRPHCGMYLPCDITDGVALGAYLASAETVRLCVHEPGEETSHDVTYTRGVGAALDERN